VTDLEQHGRNGPGLLAWVVVLDVLAKLVLVLAMARVAVDPGWGNLEGKSPTTRAVTYPMLAFVVPAAHLWLRSGRRYPWVADLLVTLPAFSDILGNRLDLFDRVVWFDDLMHFVATGALSGAVVLLAGADRAPAPRRLEIGVAAGMTLALWWEVWEYLAFVTRSSEVGTAYADTVGDLTLGWTGAVVAALLVGIRVPGDGGHARHDRDERTAVLGAWPPRGERVRRRG
jgi:hypothetical protein